MTKYEGNWSSKEEEENIMEFASPSLAYSTDIQPQWLTDEVIYQGETGIISDCIDNEYIWTVTSMDPPDVHLAKQY